MSSEEQRVSILIHAGTVIEAGMDWRCRATGQVMQVHAIRLLGVPHFGAFPHLVDLFALDHLQVVTVSPDELISDYAPLRDAETLIAQIPEDADLTADLGRHHEAAQTERVFFPWHDMSMHPGVHLLTAIADELVKTDRAAAVLAAVAPLTRWTPAENLGKQLAELLLGLHVVASRAGINLPAATEAALRTMYEEQP